jgi:hypothetical protein
MTDFLPVRDLGLLLLDDRVIPGSVEQVLDSLLVSALCFDRPRTLPVRLPAESWSTSIGCSSLAGGWRSSVSPSFMPRVHVYWRGGFRGAEAKEGV